ILKNSVYEELEKLSNPGIETTQNSEVKNKMNENLTSLTTTDGEGSGAESGMPQAVSDAQSSDSTNEEPSEEEKEAFTNMHNATGFYDYILDYPEVNDGMERTDTVGLSSVGGTVDMSDNDSATDGADNLLTVVSDLMNKLGELMGNLAENGRDAFLVTEYFTSNFSCHTTSMDGTGKRQNNEKMLSGTLFCDEKWQNVGYGCELEYILYGQDNEFANKTCAGGSIFAIRFVLNLIYSFTDPEIRSFTLSVATAVSGVFPFLVPIVQTVLHIGLSLAESGIDLYYLMKGAAVPLYKSSATWVCKGTNIIRKAAGELITAVADEVIDKTADTLCDAIAKAGDKASETITSTSTQVQDFVKNKVDELTAQVHATVMAPVREVLQYCMLNIGRIRTFADQSVEEAKKEIKGLLDSAIEKSIESLKEESGDFVSDNAVKALEKIQGKTATISGLIFDNLEDLIKTSVSDTVSSMENAVNEVYGALDTFVDEKLTIVGEEITSTLNDDVIGSLTTSLNNAVTSAVSEAQDAVNKTSADIKEKINSKVAEAVNGHKDVTITSGGKATSADHVLDMTYKDYLYIFTLIGSFDNKNTAMFERAAKLMQANCERRGAATNYTDGNLNKDIYSLNKSYTLIQATSGASTSTVFYGAVFKDGELDLSGRKDYEFTYMSYMGY
ncbi:MAG: DUF5702 domain-containing protein, partial [Oscillospiraceae bacterium]